MLSSLNSSASSSSHEEQEHHRRHHPAARQLLVSCADLVGRGDLPAAQRAVGLLLGAASPFGDAADRLAHQFALALSIRADGRLRRSSTPEAVQSAYLAFNQITPFLRFAHLTANQAILEAVEGSPCVHILDFDTSHGLQWPPLLQAIAERADHENPPPAIRITGTGSCLDVLRRTGRRLQTFADSLNLRFEFHPLLLPPDSAVPADLNLTFHLRPGETLAVNCVLFLHKLLKDDDDDRGELRAFLAAVRGANPAVVAVAEREASHGSPVFLQRFAEAMDYYAAVFEALEATLPPTSRERVAVEQVWLGQEINGVVVGTERHEAFVRWEAAMRAAGFHNRPLSPFALSQARLLLRLHYPSEGYQLQAARDAAFLGWQNKALFSVSSWH